MFKIYLKSVLATILLSCAITTFSQNDFYILQGKIVDAKTGLRIKDVEYSIPTLKLYTTAKDGTFAIAVTPGKHFIQFMHPDFNLKLMEYNAMRDSIVVIKMEPSMLSFLIDEVEVVDKYNNKVHDAPIGVEKVKMRSLELIPNLGGEKDPLKAVYHLPGVQMSGEASSDLIVRGGLPSQNRFLFDNAQIFNTNHAFGLLSTFNPGAIGSLDLYKGGFPARYSGGLSSIVQMNSKTIDYEKFYGSATVGIISASLLLNIPVIEEKSGLLFSARRTYADALIRLFQKKDEGMESFNFHDVYLKYSHNMGDLGNLSMSGYFDRDKMYYLHKHNETKNRTYTETAKRNQFVQALWEYKFKGWKNNLSLALSNYLDSDYCEESGGAYSIISTGIRTINFKNISSHQLSEQFGFEGGLELTSIYYMPFTYEADDELYDTVIKAFHHKSAPYSSLFGQLNYENGRHSATLGYRNSLLWRKNEFTMMHEPRFVYKNKLNNRSALQFSYSRIYQPSHQLTNPGLDRKMNIYISSTKIGAPEFSDQISAGYFIDFFAGRNQLNLSCETYVKNMQNITTYNDGYGSYWFGGNENMGSIFDKAIAHGNGYSYGAEFMVQKQQGAFIGSVAYTLSLSKHRFDNINGGKYFFSPYDRRHDMNIVASYKLNHKWDFSAQWQFQTGLPYTAPLFAYSAGQFDYQTGGFLNMFDTDNVDVTIPFYAFGKRNASRMIPYHRLDLSIRRHTKNKLGTGTWELSVYNVYNRRNAAYYFVDIEWDTEGNYEIQMKYWSLLPIVPSISYTLKF